MTDNEKEIIYNKFLENQKDIINTLIENQKEIIIKIQKIDSERCKKKSKYDLIKTLAFIALFMVAFISITIIYKYKDVECPKSDITTTTSVENNTLDNNSNINIGRE